MQIKQIGLTHCFKEKDNLLENFKFDLPNVILCIWGNYIKNIKDLLKT